MSAPKFQMHKEVSEDRYTFYLMGELDLSQADEVREAVNPIVGEAGRDLVLNLRDLSYIDSTGIGVILSILKARDALKVPLKVEFIPPKIQRLFDITGLTPFLTA